MSVSIAQFLSFDKNKSLPSLNIYTQKRLINNHRWLVFVTPYWEMPKALPSKVAQTMHHQETTRFSSYKEKVSPPPPPPRPPLPRITFCAPLSAAPLAPSSPPCHLQHTFSFKSQPTNPCPKKEKKNELPNLTNQLTNPT